MWSMWSVKKFYGLFVNAWNKGNILATLPGRTSILKSAGSYLLSREEEMVRIRAKEIVSGAVWTHGFAVEETSGDRKQSDAYGSQGENVITKKVKLWMRWFVPSRHTVVFGAMLRL